MDVRLNKRMTMGVPVKPPESWGDNDDLNTMVIFLCWPADV